MILENRLNELSGTSLITKEFINRIIRRIESLASQAGIDGAGATAGISGYKEITLNVCKDGAPSTITVLGK